MRTAIAVLLAVVAFLSLSAFAPGIARATNDPSLSWYTLETEHFRITYHSGDEEVAQRVANIAEGIYGTMTRALGHSPRVKTEISLSDFSESANGSATALPYNAIRLLVTAPEDLAPLGDVDDWYLELTTHELTHVLHTDNIHGLPALVNAVLGKTLAPNQVQPRWILEGLAVYEESARTSGGRLRSSIWDMYMRTDVLEDNVATIDQISNNVRRWPQGNLWYLYGSYFVDWIVSTYGEHAFRDVSRYYGAQLIPWGINRAIMRATGKTYVDLYPAWIASMKAKYGAKAQAIRDAGIREGVRLTHDGQIARYPRWIPDNAWPDHKGGILYYRDDARYRTGLFAVDLDKDELGRVRKSTGAELVARTSGESYPSFLPDGGVVFSSREFYKYVFLFGDLERMAPGQKSKFGTPDGGRQRITPLGFRASDPSTSPDGRRVVFTTNRAGTRTLQIAALEPEGVEESHELVPSQRFEQAFTPRWSPDGAHVAYSVWKHGGYRDIRIVDVRDGSWRDVMNDRATDGGPTYSPDGRFVFFHSDRSGVFNIYALELATGRIKQVTNVLTGAFSPDVSPDGKNLAYIGYTKAGFDLFAMPIDESTWTDAEPYVDDRPPMPAISQRRWTPTPYNPLATLVPRRYGVQITPGNFGQAIIVSASQSDLVGNHAVAASMTVEVEKPYLQGAIGYTYGRLPFDFSVSGYRTIVPRAGYAIGAYKPVVIQENLGFGTTIAFNIPRAYDSQGFVVSHVLSRVGAELPMPADKLDPYETPQLPARGLASTLHFGYSYSNAERYLWSVGPERGFTYGLAFDWTDPTLGSQYSGYAASSDLTFYLLMPWLRHHSLALHGGGGTSGGLIPGRGAFYVGGFVDVPLVDTLRNLLVQGGLVLRGYEPVVLAGRSYVLTNAEYRFPIVNIDHGPSTLPIFLNRITGAVFVDYGSAFDSFADAQFKTGTGGELWFDTTLGYVASLTFRAGYARGLASGGMDKLYFIATIPF